MSLASLWHNNTITKYYSYCSTLKKIQTWNPIPLSIYVVRQNTELVFCGVLRRQPVSMSLKYRLHEHLLCQPNVYFINEFRKWYPNRIMYPRIQNVCSTDWGNAYRKHFISFRNEIWYWYVRMLACAMRRSILFLYDLTYLTCFTRNVTTGVNHMCKLLVKLVNKFLIVYPYNIMSSMY